MKYVKIELDIVQAKATFKLIDDAINSLVCLDERLALIQVKYRLETHIQHYIKEKETTKELTSC